MLNHVPQKAPEGDCGAAVIAIAAGVTYERVMQSVPPDIIPHGLWHPEILHALYKITGTHWGVIEYTVVQPAMRYYEFPKRPLIVGLRKPEWNYIYHYVVVDGEYLYDPLELEPLPLSKVMASTQGGWLIQAVFHDSRLS